MTIRKKTISAASLLATSLLLQGCATIVGGMSQKIPVTSTPLGAKVIVDGKEAGTAPLILKLKRRKPHVIRIEQAGFNPHEIRISRAKPSRYSVFNLGNVVLGFPLCYVLMPKSPIEGGDYGEEIGNAIGKALVRYAVILPLLATAAAMPFVATDFLTGAAYSLSPKTLDVTLTSDPETPRPKTTEIDGAALRDVIWLRVRTFDKRVPRTD